MVGRSPGRFRLWWLRLWILAAAFGFGGGLGVVVAAADAASKELATSVVDVPSANIMLFLLLVVAATAILLVTSGVVPTTTTTAATTFASTPSITVCGATVVVTTFPPRSQHVPSIFFSLPSSVFFHFCFFVSFE